MRVARHRDKLSVAPSEKSAVVRAACFTKPTISEIKAKAKEIGLPESEVEKFFNYHESKGWKVGNSPMKSWPHALGTRKGNLGSFSRPNQPTTRTLSYIPDATYDSSKDEA